MQSTVQRPCEFHIFRLGQQCENFVCCHFQHPLRIVCVGGVVEAHVIEQLNVGLSQDRFEKPLFRAEAVVNHLTSHPGFPRNRFDIGGSDPMQYEVFECSLIEHL